MKFVIGFFRRNFTEKIILNSKSHGNLLEIIGRQIGSKYSQALVEIFDWIDEHLPEQPLKYVVIGKYDFFLFQI